MRAGWSPLVVEKSFEMSEGLTQAEVAEGKARGGRARELVGRSFELRRTEQSTEATPHARSSLSWLTGTCDSMSQPKVRNDKR